MKQCSGDISGSIHSILNTDLNMHYLCQHSVPKMLTPTHKGTRMTLARDLITVADQDVDF
jgi:hypothetical protein